MSDTVRLYYLGGAPEREGQDGRHYVYVSSRNTPFIIPVEQGFIDVRGYFARDLMRRYNTPEREIFSTNPDLKAQTQAAAQRDLTREELVEMLKKMDQEDARKKPSSPRRTTKKSDEGGE